MTGWVLSYDMDHINNLKVKDLNVLLWYNLETEKLMEVPKKVELIEDVTKLFRKNAEGLDHREGWRIYFNLIKLVKNLMQIWEKDVAPVDVYDYGIGFSLGIIYWIGVIGLWDKNIYNHGFGQWMEY